MVKGERAIFLRALAVLFNSGVPINHALGILSVQFSPPLGVAATHMADQIESGYSLERAMQSEDRVFTRLQVKMIQVGTRTGGLGVVLERLARHEEKQQALAAQTRSALSQPAVVFIVCLTMAIFLPPYLFRDLLRMLAESGVPLPAITEGLILFSKAVRTPALWGIATVFLAALLTGGIRLWARPRVRFAVYHGLFLLRGIGPALKAVVLCRFARALEATVSVGLTLQESLRLAGQAADNPVLEEAAEKSLISVLEGSPLARALEQTGFFPVLFVQAVRVGEETGKLSSALSNLARIYDFELENRLEAMNALLEPLITALIGVVVGIVVVATLLPMSRFLEQL